MHTADVMAATLGVAGDPYATINHPIGRLEPAHLTERMDQAVPAVIDLLLKEISTAKCRQ